jgi:hypothetical protein
MNLDSMDAIDQAYRLLSIGSMMPMRQQVHPGYSQTHDGVLHSMPNRPTQMHWRVEPNGRRRNRQHCSTLSSRTATPMTQQPLCRFLLDSPWQAQRTMRPTRLVERHNHCHRRQPNAANPPGDTRPEETVGRRLRALRVVLGSKQRPASAVGLETDWWSAVKLSS